MILRGLIFCQKNYKIQLERQTRIPWKSVGRDQFHRSNTGKTEPENSDHQDQPVQGVQLAPNKVCALPD